MLHRVTFAVLVLAAVPAAAGPLECSYTEEVLGIDMEGRDCIKGNAVALDGYTLLLTPLPPDPQEKPPEEPPTALKDVIDPLAMPLEPIKVRLWGVDAPEMTEADGWNARAAMDQFLSVFGPTVVCAVVDKDRHGRRVAVCDASGRDPGMALIESGWGIEHRLYTRTGSVADWRFYEWAEAAARAYRRGRWARMPAEPD